MIPICIVGAGGLGKCAKAVAYVTRSSVAVLDDKASNVYGTLGLLNDKKFVATHNFVVAIGDNKIRAEIYRRISKNKGKFDKLIHPSTIAAANQIGDGTIVLPGVILGPDVSVGDNCVLGNRVSVAHDCMISNDVNICDGAVLGGGVIVGDMTFIGLNATILPKVFIGANAVIGAGAVVVDDVPAGAIVYGNPARQQCYPSSDPSIPSLKSSTPTSAAV